MRFNAAELARIVFGVHAAVGERRRRRGLPQEEIAEDVNRVRDVPAAIVVRVLVLAAAAEPEMSRWASPLALPR